MGEARFLRKRIPGYVRMLNGPSPGVLSGNIKVNSAVFKFLQEQKMDKLSLPKNIKPVNAASLMVGKQTESDFVAHSKTLSTPMKLKQDTLAPLAKLDMRRKSKYFEEDTNWMQNGRSKSTIFKMNLTFRTYKC